MKIKVKFPDAQNLLFLFFFNSKNSSTIFASSRFEFSSNFHNRRNVANSVQQAPPPGCLNRGHFTRYLGASARQPKSFVASSVTAADLRRYQGNQLDPGRIVVGPVINKCLVLKVNFSIRFTCEIYDVNLRTRVSV